MFVASRGWLFVALLLPLAAAVKISLRAMSASGAAMAARTAGVPTPTVILISIDGAINPAVADYVEGAIAVAAADNSAAVVVQLDTPGGLLASAEQIVKALLNSPVPTIVYVAPSGASAASAGTFITEAANVAAMAPGTTIGAAHPVTEFGGKLSGTMAKKMENFVATFASTIARERGRNASWMEQAVRQSAAIGADEALKLKVIDLIVPDLVTLLKEVSGRSVRIGSRMVRLELADARVQRRSMTLGERIVNLLADPNLMYLLLMAGIVGLYFEFAHPGVFLPGVAGAICLLLALASFAIVPIDLSGLMLILLGAVLLITEAYVTSYGVLGLGGVVALVLGSLFLVNRGETNLVVDRGIIFGAALAMAAIILGIGYVVVRERKGRARTGIEGLVGEIGEVRVAIAPATPGWLFVHGEIWRARSAETLEVGARARIKAVHGLELDVSRVDGQKESAPGP